MNIEVWCCEHCAREAKKRSRDFEIMGRIPALPDAPECDLCGEKDAVLRCYDCPSDDD